MATAAPTATAASNGHVERWGQLSHFQMPVHYPRYARPDYETMPEWKLDCLLREYGLTVTGDVHHKRKFAMASFLWIN